jgi:ribonuclease G
VRVDSKLGFERLQNFSNRFMPHLQAKLGYYHGDTPLFDLANVDQAIARALAKRVDLKSGGYLVFDETEALITIDVNTGAFVGTKNFEDTILQTNLEAAQTIARELRLRNLGGIIIIDFIDMEREDYRTTVLDELRKKLQLDRVKTLVNDFSQLGLVEMTRKRSSKSLSQMLTQACTVCHGVGRVKSVRTIAYEILREIKREDQKSNPNGFLVVAHPNVAQALLTEESIPLKALSDSIAKPISLQAQPTLGQDDYDIVLL